MSGLYVTSSFVGADGARGGGGGGVGLVVTFVIGGGGKSTGTVILMSGAITCTGGRSFRSTGGGGGGRSFGFSVWMMLGSRMVCTWAAPWGAKPLMNPQITIACTTMMARKATRRRETWPESVG